MDDLELLWLPGSASNTVRVASPLAGEGTARVSHAEVAKIAAAFERLARGPGREIADAVQVGKMLYAAVFKGQVAEVLRDAVKAARERSGLRLLLKIGPTTPAARLPWEMVHDGRRFLANNPQTPLVRYVEQGRPVRSPRLGRPLRVLFTSACPAGQPSLDIASEERRLRQALSAPWVRLDPFSGVTFERLEFLLRHAEHQRTPFDVWHHGGHGGKSGELLLNSERPGAEQVVSPADVGSLIKDCPHLGVVVLNVCYGGGESGLATALACRNLPVAIGFRARIEDRAALCFAAAFYRGLLRYPIEVALTRARLELAFEGSLPLNWAQPILYSRTMSAEVPGRGLE
jgi:hypothetical protein